MQTLKYIGPKRAERIVAYRDSVGPIHSLGDLATITGLSLNQLAELENLIDWQLTPREQTYSTLIASLAYAASLGVFLVSAFQFQFEAGGGYQLVLNLSLVAILLAGLSLIQHALTNSTTRLRTLRWQKPLAQAGYLMFAAGMSGLFWLGFVATGIEADFASSVAQIQKFIAVAALIVFMMIFPPFHVRALGEAQHASHRLVSRGYDILVIVIAMISINRIHGNESADLIDTVYALWLAVICLISAWETGQGHPAMNAMLSDRDQARLRFILDTGSDSEIHPESGPESDPESEKVTPQSRVFRVGTTLLLIAAAMTLLALAIGWA